MELKGDKKYVAFSSGHNSGVKDMAGVKEWAAQHLMKGIAEVVISEVIGVAKLPALAVSIEPLENGAHGLQKSA